MDKINTYISIFNGELSNIVMSLAGYFSYLKYLFSWIAI